MYIISTYKEKFFNETVLPILIKRQFKNNVDRLKDHKETLKMEEYIKENFDVDFQDVSNNLLKFISVSEVNGKYIIRIDKNKNYPEKNFKFITLTNLIDNGNLSIKGLHLLDSAMSFIQQRIDHIHNMCERGIKVWQ